MMLFDDPFLFGALRRLRRRPWALSLCLVGPALVLTPLSLGHLFHHSVDSQEALALGVQLLVSYLCLRAVGSTLGALLSQRDRAHWDVLLTSGLKPGQIARSLWMISAWPCILEALLGAGVVWALDPGLGLSAGWLFLGLTVFHVNWGLFCSLRFRDWNAAQWAYGWLAFWGLSGFAFWLYHELHSGRSGFSWLMLVNPWYLAGSLFHGEFVNSVVGANLYWVLALFVGLRVGREVSQGTQPTTAPLLSRCRPQQKDPLAYRNQFPRSPWRTLGVLAVYLLLLLGPGWFRGYSTKDSAFLALVGHLAFWLIRSLHISTSVLSRERQGGTLDALITTLLTPQELRQSYWRQCVQPVLLESLLLSPLLLWVCSERPEVWPYLVLLTSVTICGWGATGLALSLRCRSTLAAFQACYVSLAFVLFGTLMIDVCIVGEFTNYNGPLLSLINPLVAGLAAVERSPHPDWRLWAAVFCVGIHALAWFGGLRYLQSRFACRSGL